MGSTIVVVVKRGHKFRIRGDFKVTVSPFLKVEQYNISKPQHLFHRLTGGQHFTKLNMSHAYLQLQLADSSKEMVNVNTPFFFPANVKELKAFMDKVNYNTKFLKQFFAIAFTIK